MADHNSFILYEDHRDLIEAISDEEAGQLLKALFAYKFDGVDIVAESSSMLRATFSVIRKAIDRNELKYQEKCEKNRRNAQDEWDRRRSPGQPFYKPKAAAGERMRAHALDADSDRDSDSDDGSDYDSDDGYGMIAQGKGEVKGEGRGAGGTMGETMGENKTAQEQGMSDVMNLFQQKQAEIKRGKRANAR